MKPSRVAKTIIEDDEEEEEEIMSFYKDPETDHVMGHYNKLCKKDNFKTIKLKGPNDFFKWWDWINDCTRFCGLNDICTKLLQNANKTNAKKIKCKEDEEYLVKKLINNSVDDMAYDMKSLTNAQDWLIEAVTIAGMKVSATVLQQTTHKFNLNEKLTKQQTLKEWKVLLMQHDIMGTVPNEGEIIDRFTTYVYTVIKDNDLKQELIQINENGEGVMKAINAFYNWKSKNDRYAGGENNAMTPTTVAAGGAAVPVVGAVNNKRTRDTVPFNRDVRRRLPKFCAFCSSNNHAVDRCSRKHKQGCWGCGSEHHNWYACPKNSKNTRDSTRGRGNKDSPNGDKNSSRGRQARDRSTSRDRRRSDSRERNKDNSKQFSVAGLLDLINDGVLSVNHTNFEEALARHRG